jgi:osmotically inducible lipoprotein OsmB
MHQLYAKLLQWSLAPALVGLSLVTGLCLMSEMSWRGSEPLRPRRRCSATGEITMRSFTTLFAIVGFAAATAACGSTIEQKAATGAVAGAVVAGPVGAAVGGAAGAASGHADRPN